MLEPYNKDIEVPTRRSVGENLETEATKLRSRLADLEAAIEALHSNPEVERIINIVSKVHNGDYARY